MSKEEKNAKIRAALAQLNPVDDNHWTEDGLPREGVVRKLANDQTVSRKDIQEAQPGFERRPVEASAKATVDGLTGEASEDTLKGDPRTNTGEPMTDDEVHAHLQATVADAEKELADAQQAVRDAQNRVIAAQEGVKDAKTEFSREFPPLTPAENIKQYIASEMAQRIAAANGGRPSMSQIDLAHMRSNSRGWRRPRISGPPQTGAARVVT